MRDPKSSRPPDAPHRFDRGRSYRVMERAQVEVYDLDFAAYLSLRDIAMAEACRYAQGTLFRFHDPDGQVPKLAIEYVNSESAKFADAQRRLKKVIISRPM